MSECRESPHPFDPGPEKKCNKCGKTDRFSPVHTQYPHEFNPEENHYDLCEICGKFASEEWHD